MKLAIIAFNAQRNPTRSSVKTGGDVRKEFLRMKRDGESLEGLSVVELWTEDNGVVERYFAKGQTSTFKKKGSSLKTFLSVILLSVFALTASAQKYAAQPLSGFPATLAANTSSNLANSVVIDCRKAKDVTIQTTFNLSAAATTNMVYTFARSVDGTYWDTTGRDTWNVAMNGTTVVTASTNIDVGGYAFLKLISIANWDADGVATNTAIKYSLKISAH